jgi:Polysaccharide biosynthesis/export protein
VARISRICGCVLLMALGLGVSGCSGGLRLTGLGGFDEEPAVGTAVAANSVVANSVVANPVAANPVAANPLVANPLVANPLVANPLVANPLVANPLVASPVAANGVVVNAAPPKMHAGDYINVTVYNEASLSGNYALDSGGFVTIPRAGRLRAAGLTPSELADLLVKKFRGEYLNNPKVTVALI